MKRPLRLLPLLLAAALAAGLTGCVRQEAAHTPAPTVTVPATPNQTPVPAETPAPAATTAPIPAATPEPTETAAPAETPEVTEEPGFRVAGDASVAYVTARTGSDFDAQVGKAVQSFCEANGKTCAYYSPSGSDLSPFPSLTSALADGRRVIVAGPEFEELIPACQEEYPDAAFLLLDGFLEDPGPNTAAARFDEVQMGYLAGYAAVSEGYTKLGYVTNLDDLSSARYGCGYIQGAEDAAAVAGVTVSMLYDPLGAESSTDEAGEMAFLLYRSGIQVIFAPGEGLDRALEDAATAGGRNGAILTENTLEGAQHIIATVEKDPSQVLPRLLAAAYNGGFPGGQNLTLGCAENGVDLDASRLTRMSRYDYEHVHGTLATGAAAPLTPEVSGGPQGLVHDHVTVTFLPRTVTVETAAPDEAAEDTAPAEVSPSADPT